MDKYARVPRNEFATQRYERNRRVRVFIQFEEVAKMKNYFGEIVAVPLRD
jgi:hypothetical protein